MLRRLGISNEQQQPLLHHSPPHSSSPRKHLLTATTLACACLLIWITFSTFSRQEPSEVFVAEEFEYPVADGVFEAEELLGETQVKNSPVGQVVIPKLVMKLRQGGMALKQLQKTKCSRYEAEDTCNVADNPTCIWDYNTESCELCRSLTRKTKQYDEADACGVDDFELKCDLNAPKSRIFVRQVKQDVYRDKSMTERAKAWRSKVRARSITTYCATNMNQENSMCLVDRDLFVTPGTNDQALFIIKYVCIYENLMLKPPEVYVDPNKLQARPPSSQILANLKAKSKSRTAAQKAALLAKIEERRKLAREKAAKKTEMENACSAIKNATECIEGCFWNSNMPEGEQCSLCRGLTRKNPSYDEGDACLPDYFTLVCDDRGKDARIFVREVIQDISANAVSDAEKQWRSKTRARKITTFCALGNNFAHNQCSFRRAQLAGNEVTPGAIFTIKYVCFYSNRLPAVPRIWFDPLTSTQAILDLARRLQIETEEEAQEEEKKQLTAKKNRRGRRKEVEKEEKERLFCFVG